MNNNTNKTYAGVPIWSEYVSQTELPTYKESTNTGFEKIIFESTII